MPVLCLATACTDDRDTGRDGLRNQTEASSSLTTSSTTSTTLAPDSEPSQSPQDAIRDGVLPELASLPSPIRVKKLLELGAADGTWVVSRASDALDARTASAGCLLGDPAGAYGTERICTNEYGEVLLMGDGAVIKARLPHAGHTPDVDVPDRGGGPCWPERRRGTS
jgi:hypothetical protein